MDYKSLHSNQYLSDSFTRKHGGSTTSSPAAASRSQAMSSTGGGSGLSAILNSSAHTNGFMDSPDEHKAQHQSNESNTRTPPAACTSFDMAALDSVLRTLTTSNSEQHVQLLQTVERIMDKRGTNDDQLQRLTIKNETLEAKNDVLQAKNEQLMEDKRQLTEQLMFERERTREYANATMMMQQQQMQASASVAWTQQQLMAHCQQQVHASATPPSDPLRAMNAQMDRENRQPITALDLHNTNTNTVQPPASVPVPVPQLQSAMASVPVPVPQPQSAMATVAAPKQTLPAVQPVAQSEHKDFTMGGFSFNAPPKVAVTDKAKPATPVQTNTGNKPEGKPSPFAAFKGFTSPSSKTPDVDSSSTARAPLLTTPKDTSTPLTTMTPTTTATSTSTAASTITGTGPATTAPKSTFSFSFNPPASMSPITQSGANKAAPSLVFGGAAKTIDTATPGNKDRSRTESAGSDDHFEPNIEFAPVVPLPNLVEVVTGEEEEQVLFNARAKLFRWVAESQEYKERGLGDLKILKHSSTGKIRLLLRREQVHKLAANHNLTSTMELKPMANAQRAHCWHAQDFAEMEVKAELFAARFKTDEQAAEFKRVFEQCVQELAASNQTFSPPKQPQEVASTASVPASVSNTNLFTAKTPTDSRPNVPVPITAGSFGDQFKPKAGSWECPGCMARNQADADKCPCCDTMRDGSTSSSVQSAVAPSTTGFSFGLGAAGKGTAPAATFGLANTSVSSTTNTTLNTTNDLGMASGFSFKPSALDASTASVLSNSFQQSSAGSSPQNFSFKLAATNTPTNTSATYNTTANGTTTNKVLFGQNTGSSITNGTVAPAATATPATLTFSFGGVSKSTTVSGTPPTFGAAAKGLSFGALASAQSGVATGGAFQAKQKQGALFAGTGVKAFANLSSGQDMSQPQSRTRTESAGSDDHFEPNIEFAPVVPLPNLVEVVTGEEGEQVLFNSRAKLFRWVADSQEYKERGLGDLKILKHSNTGKIRLLLRREQVHKLAANHYITGSMELKPMANAQRAYCWHAQDFAEMEVKAELFAARFKTDEQAAEFKRVFEQCVHELAASNQAFSPPRQTPAQQQITPFTLDKTDDDDGGELSDYEDRVLAALTARDEGGEEADVVWQGQGTLRLDNDTVQVTARMQANDCGYVLRLVDAAGVDRIVHMIMMEHKVQLSSKSTSPWFAHWTAHVDGRPCKLRLDFNNLQTRDAFATAFKEGVELAVVNNLSEQTISKAQSADVSPYKQLLNATKNKVVHDPGSP